MDQPTSLLDQVAKLQAQIVLLKQQNAFLTARNDELREDLRNTKTELRDTQALLGKAIVKASRPQSVSPPKSRSPSLRYTPPLAPFSKRKRSRSPTLEYVDPPPPPKMVKLELPSTVEVITIDDSDNPPSDTELGTVAQTVDRTTAEANPPSRAREHDSDLDDPNISQDEAERAGHRDRQPEIRNVVRRSASLSTMSSLTTMSTLSPLLSTCELEDESHPKFDIKPKREPKREAFTALTSVISMYLSDPQPLPITPTPVSLEVPRAFLRLAYGGCDQRFLQYVPAARNPGPSHTLITNADGSTKRVPKGPRRMVFPALDRNPLMPRTPGAPGLVFTSREEILHDPPWTLFFKRARGKEHAVWLYLGEYECELVGRLTAEQFKAQPAAVKKSWASLVIKRRRQECYATMRARIALRAVGLIPIDDKDREEELIRLEVNNIRSRKGKGKNITINQVLQAFANGDEAINIIRMKCVKYDHVFANDVVSQFDHYPTMLTAANAKKQTKKEAKEQKQGQKKKASKSASTSSRGRFSNTNVKKELDTDEDEELDSDDEPSNSSNRQKAFA